MQVHRVHWEKNRFIYDLMYKQKVMQRELYDYLVRENARVEAAMKEYADTTTQVVWSEPRQRYLATSRIDSTSATITRTVLISESEDFISWQRLGTLGADRFDPVYAREFYDLPFFEVPHSGGLLVGCLNIYHIIDSWEGPNCPPSPRPSWFDRLSYQLVSSRNGSQQWKRARTT